MNRRRGAVRELSYEEHALHWVANLPNDEYLILLSYLWTICPQVVPGTVLWGRKLRVHTIITSVLLPIMREDGYIPLRLRQHIRDLDLSTWRVDKIMTRLYRQAMSRAGRTVPC